MAASNLHGTALVVGDRGVLIVGASGSGKTTLALTLLAQLQKSGQFARLVADDQLLVSQRGGRLVLVAPPAIQGLTEVHGLGPCPIDVEAKAVIDLVVRLLPAAERFPEEESEIISGCAIPCLRLCERNAVGARPAVLARLSIPPLCRTA
ncbi:HPr kinase/phosphorylase [Pseudaminobacter arsenicus]|uniref:HPr kinase/phosphorylase n=1 Tax=Borborobacter arsenicus TaxID=1851146 RepID=A0A432V8Z8_9HYPH|nr:HPr kinase/phosphorylase [Pseudaminobacter arsenicus]RUM98563.1 HPr kinase/phosphorylase [Pseudaminobacter arsenicus]